jgi:hypothetical protein
MEHTAESVKKITDGYQRWLKTPAGVLWSTNQKSSQKREDNKVLQTA